MKKTKKSNVSFIVAIGLTVFIFLVLPLMVLVIRKQMDDRSKASHNPTVSTPWIISDPSQCPGGPCLDDFFAMQLSPASLSEIIADQPFQMRFEFSRTLAHPNTPSHHAVNFKFYRVEPNGQNGTLIKTHSLNLTTSFQPWVTQVVLSPTFQLAAGTYNAVATVDDMRHIDEINEDNNSIAVQITVVGSASNPAKPPAVITFPKENQVVSRSVDQSFCLDTAAGDKGNLMRRFKINNYDWTDYKIILYDVPAPPICFEPAKGVNKVQLQYKSPSGEGDALTRTFAMNWTCPAGPHLNYDDSNQAINLSDYITFLNFWRSGGPRGNYDCSDATNLRDYILYINAWRKR